MITINKSIKGALLPIIAAGALFASCNKDVQQFPLPATISYSGITLDSVLKTTPSDSLFYRMIIRASSVSGGTNYVNLLKTTGVSNQYTIFAVDNNGMKAFINAASGGLVPLAAPDAVFSGFITSSLPAATAAGIVGYNIVPQRYDTASIPAVFPNIQVGTLVQIAPTTAPFVTLTTFPSKNAAGVLRVNTLPMTTPLNVNAVNGIIHHVASVVAPPQRLIWERINTDADLTIFKAAIARADSGTVTTSVPAGALGTAFQTGPANLTVFAPTNLAMKQTISLLTGGLIPVAAPDANFISFLGSPLITTRLVKGIVVYHIFDDRSTTAATGMVNKRPGRTFTANLPSVTTSFSTLLSSADSIGVTYPKVALTATFTGPFVSAATIKGAANTTASNLLINSTPDQLGSYGTTPPATPVVYTGTSDQLYVNGILHKIDQVLRPQ